MGLHQPTQNTGPAVRKLKKGELLFAEGENSRAMYIIRKGIVRLFKKKGDSQIELDIIRSGSVLGELAFLDGNPRSASAEAITEVEVVEVSGPTFQAVLDKMPEWLKLLLKTVVGRLRTASNRIRQLETASVAYDYGEKGTATKFIFLSRHDTLKILSIIFLSALRGKQEPTGLEVRELLLNRYGNQIFGIPASKLNSVLDVLCQAGMIELVENNDQPDKFVLKDMPFLESLITYLNEENLNEPKKRHDISNPGFVIMGYLAKHLPKYQKDANGGVIKVNVAEIHKAEVKEDGRESFRMDQFSELVTLGYASQIEMKSGSEAYTIVHPDDFTKAFRFQKVVKMIEALNEQKQKGGGYKAA